MVARPCVVCLALEIGNALHLRLSDSGGQQRFHLFRMWMYDEQRLT